jgi:SAM-dependent methyltransferase
VAIVGLIGVLVAAHIGLSDVDFLAHNATVPVLIFPVAYFAAVFGLRGAVAATVMSALVLIDDPTEGRPLHTALEIVQLLGVGVAGVMLAALVTRELRRFEGVRVREVDRQQRLRRGPGYWDRVAATRMGLYVTNLESSFVLESLGAGAPGLVLDVGAGAGRLEPALLQRSAGVLATEVDADVIRSMEAHERVQPLLVGAPVGSLPFADASLDWIVSVEVPVVSDEAWFRAECARVLKPGGGVLVTVHNAFSYKGLWARAIGSWLPAARRSWTDAYYRHGLGWHRRRWQEAGFDLEASTGFYWPPFSRRSDSALVTLFSVLERLLGLRRAVSLSPWVFLRLRLKPR